MTMLTAPVAGGVVLAPTQLVQWHSPEPTQYIVTLAQAQRDANAVPWQMPAEGGTAIIPTNIPTIPSGADALMCDIRFGVAGASTRVLFDYPSAGGTFGITADAIELTVRTRKTPSDTLATVVPQVGAMLVEGIATSSEMTWTEAGVTFVANTSRYWTVKPFAKTLRVAVINAAGGEIVTFIGGPPASPTLWRQHVAAAGASVLEVPVPSGAVMVQFQNLAATPTAFLQWVVELS